MRPRRNRKLHEDVSKRRNADPMPMPMIHTDTDRFVAFESIENGRELGGLAMRDGRKIQHNRLVRSGHLARASDGDVAMLKGRFGTSHVFDFRFDAETRDAEDRRMEGVCYTRLSTLPKAFVEGFTSGRADTGCAVALLAGQGSGGMGHGLRARRPGGGPTNHRRGFRPLQ